MLFVRGGYRGPHLSTTRATKSAITWRLYAKLKRLARATVPQPRAARFDGSLLCLPIYGDEAELGAVSAHPFEVVKSRPAEFEPAAA
jgi:hypothetical protein